MAKPPLGASRQPNACLDKPPASPAGSDSSICSVPISPRSPVEVINLESDEDCPQQDQQPNYNSASPSQRANNACGDVTNVDTPAVLSVDTPAVLSVDTPAVTSGDTPAVTNGNIEVAHSNVVDSGEHGDERRVVLAEPLNITVIVGRARDGVAPSSTAMVLSNQGKRSNASKSPRNDRNLGGESNESSRRRERPYRSGEQSASRSAAKRSCSSADSATHPDDNAKRLRTMADSVSLTGNAANKSGTSTASATRSGNSKKQSCPLAPQASSNNFGFSRGLSTRFRPPVCNYPEVRAPPNVSCSGVPNGNYNVPHRPLNYPSMYSDNPGSNFMCGYMSFDSNEPVEKQYPTYCPPRWHGQFQSNFYSNRFNGPQPYPLWPSEPSGPANLWNCPSQIDCPAAGANQLWTQNCTPTSQSQQAQYNGMHTGQQTQAVQRAPGEHEAPVPSNSSGISIRVGSFAPQCTNWIEGSEACSGESTSADQGSFPIPVQHSQHCKKKRKKRWASNCNGESHSFHCHRNAKVTPDTPDIRNQCRDSAALSGVVVIDLEAENGAVCDETSEQNVSSLTQNVVGPYHSPHWEVSLWDGNSLAGSSPLWPNSCNPSWSRSSEDISSASIISANFSSDDLSSDVSTIPSPQYDDCSSPTAPIGSSTTLVYSPASPLYSPTTPQYSPTTPRTTPTNSLCSLITSDRDSSTLPHGSPTKMVHKTFPTSMLGLPGFPASLLGYPTSPLGIPTSPLGDPTSPLDVPASPRDVSTSLFYVPASPIGIPTFPLNSPTTSSFSPYTSQGSLRTSLQSQIFPLGSPTTPVYSPSDSIDDHLFTPRQSPSKLLYSPSMPNSPLPSPKSITVSPGHLERMISEAVQKALRKAATIDSAVAKSSLLPPLPEPVTSSETPPSSVLSQTSGQDPAQHLSLQLLPLQAFVAQWGLQLTSVPLSGNGQV